MAVVSVPDRLEQKICLNFLLFPEIWSLASNNSGKPGRFSLFSSFGCGEALGTDFSERFWFLIPWKCPGWSNVGLWEVSRLEWDEL